MRAIIALVALGWTAVAGSASAQDAALPRSADDYVKAALEEPCNSGEARGQDGLCPSDGHRGFNLGPPPRRRHRAAHAPNMQGAPAETPGASALDDLRIRFDPNSAELTPRDRQEASSFAAALQSPALLKRRFEISGHTDASGTAKANLALSQARADAVVAYLVAQGVDRARLEARGYGSARPALPDAPTDPANRRVEAHSLN